MPSRKTRHKTSRHSTPKPSTPGGNTSTLSTSASYLSLHATPTQTRSNLDDSDHRYSPQYHALTPQVLYEHDHAQMSLHENPHYMHTVQTHQTDQIGANLNAFGVELPAYAHANVVQDTVSMTPLESFEACSTYPHQQYSSYQPIELSHHNSQPPCLDTQHTNIAHQHELPHDPHISFSVHGEASKAGSEQMDGQNVVYFAPQQEYYLQTTAHGDAAGLGNDLAAIGTQFDGHISSGYAQTI